MGAPHGTDVPPAVGAQGFGVAPAAAADHAGAAGSPTDAGSAHAAHDAQVPHGADAALLAASVLAEEARRQEAGAPRPEVVLPDDLLPGVGAEAMSLGAALRAGAPGPSRPWGSAVSSTASTTRPCPCSRRTSSRAWGPATR